MSLTVPYRKPRCDFSVAPCFASCVRPPSKRRVHRGARSFAGRAKRNVPYLKPVGTSPPCIKAVQSGGPLPAGSVGGEAPTVLPVSVSPANALPFCSLTLWSVNMNGLPPDKKPKNLWEPSIRLEDEKFDLLCLQETWLDYNYEHLFIPGYVLTARKDRCLGKKN